MKVSSNSFKLSALHPLDNYVARPSPSIVELIHLSEAFVSFSFGPIVSVACSCEPLYVVTRDNSLKSVLGFRSALFVPLAPAG